jgi:hypothetical protein
MQHEENSLTEKAVAAMQCAVNRVIEEHRRRCKPIVVWKDGKVVFQCPAPLAIIGIEKS